MAWFALMTKPRAEELADLDLRLRGIRTFFPHWRERVGRSKLEAKQALFKGYLFVEDPARFDTVIDADGVLYILPFPIPPAAMDRILALAPDDKKPGEIPDKIREKIDRTFRRRKESYLRVRDNATIADEKHAFFGFIVQIKAILGKRAEVEILNAALKGKRLTTALKALKAA